MNELTLLLGSNLNDRKALIQEAQQKIAASIGDVKQSSSIYETAAWGNEDQPGFLNQVLVVETSKSPEDCLAMTQMIENELGRVRFERWGPRSIDIDILYYNDLVKQQAELVIPHRQLHKRKFTLVPLVEVLPNKKHPIFNITSLEMLDKCGDELDVILFEA